MDKDECNHEIYFPLNIYMYIKMIIRILNIITFFLLVYQTCYSIIYMFGGKSWII